MSGAMRTIALVVPGAMRPFACETISPASFRSTASRSAPGIRSTISPTVQNDGSGWPFGPGRQPDVTYTRSGRSRALLTIFDTADEAEAAIAASPVSGPAGAPGSAVAGAAGTIALAR